MSPSGEPERDDSGLPPVDIEIPDDARELDRDVQAYFRELRASRRQLRSTRVHRLLSRDGMVLPLLISCLIFALITGTLLTLFTATSIDQGLPGSTGTTGGHRTSAHLVTQAPSQLPTAVVSVAGKPQSIGGLGRAVLLLVPQRCSCTGAARLLASQARARSVQPYLVASPAGLTKAEATAKSLGNGVQAAEDVNGTLQHSFRPNGLTAILVAGGDVTYAQRLQDRSDYTSILKKAGF